VTCSDAAAVDSVVFIAGLNVVVNNSVVLAWAVAVVVVLLADVVSVVVASAVNVDVDKLVWTLLVVETSSSFAAQQTVFGKCEQPTACELDHMHVMLVFRPQYPGVTTDADDVTAQGGAITQHDSHSVLFATDKQRASFDAIVGKQTPVVVFDDVVHTAVWFVDVTNGSFKQHLESADTFKQPTVIDVRFPGIP
jgi:hypothetical protein